MPDAGCYARQVRVLIVHHGLLPAPGRPTTGGALRAWHHGRALQQAGHEVVWLSRAQDAPGGFEGPADLLARARAVGPDRVICVQPEEAPPLTGLDVPLAVDLYAPRLVEAPFEGTLWREAMHTLRAVAAGDVFLVSNARQRWHWLGVLALAGVDVRTDPTLLVSLVAPEEVPAREVPDEPVLVAGGASWPWQDPVPALNRVLAHLDARGTGRVRWFGGQPLIGEPVEGWRLPEHPRLEATGWVARDELLAAYATATAAVDWMAPNPEREMALSFRHVDYLGCGLPVLTGPDTALADVLGRAGWATADIEGALDEVIDAPDQVLRRSRAARRLARRLFSLEACEGPLVSWVEWGERRPRPAAGPLPQLAELMAKLGAAEAARSAAEARLECASAEVAEKRAEVARLNEQIAVLTGTVDRLSRAMDEVAGFKREAVTVLGGQSEQARRQLADTERELAIARADLEKKSAELRAMDQLRERLEHDLDNLRQELARSRRGLFRR